MNQRFITTCIVLITVVAGIAGCTSDQHTAGGVQPLTSPPAAGTAATPAATATTEDHPANTSVCPVPPLVIDNTRPATSIPYGFSFDNDSRSYALPAGSILYHGPDGFTRVFDRNGTQILVANDSETMMPTPGGFLPSTKVLGVPSGAFVQADGNMTHIILNGTCIGTTIVSDSLPVSRGRVCHCPMMPAGSVPATPSTGPDDGLCHCS